MSIKGNVAVVTASASGIGKAIAQRLASAGAKLVISDIDEAELNATKQELESIGAEVLSLKCDMGNLKDIDNLFDETIKKFGGVDILINNAGIAGPTKSIEDIEPEEWDSTMSVNLRSQYYAIKKVIPYMKKAGKGKIVNLSSQSGKSALLKRSPYCASKMGVIGLTRCVAGEVGEYNISVNALCPGGVGGKRLDAILEKKSKLTGKTVEEIKNNALANAPFKRFVPASDVAEMAYFLSDPELSNSITGQDINVNCGAIMY